MLKDVCQLDPDGYYVGDTAAQEDPLTPGAWLLPPGAIDAPAPTVPAGQRARWDGSAWHTVPLPAPAEPTPEQRIAAIAAAAQARLDAFAKTRGYDGILSAVSYLHSTDPAFAAEAAYCRDVRDATWRQLATLAAQVAAGAVPGPSEWPEIEATLPPLEWPAE